MAPKRRPGYERFSLEREPLSAEISHQNSRPKFIVYPQPGRMKREGLWQGSLAMLLFTVGGFGMVVTSKGENLLQGLGVALFGSIGLSIFLSQLILGSFAYCE